MRVWYNRSFSSVYAAIELIRKADSGRRFTIIHSHPNRHVPAARLAHEFHTEPTGLQGDAYVDWCLSFCRRHRIDIFVPGREATLLAASTRVSRHRHPRAEHGPGAHAAADTRQGALLRRDRAAAGAGGRAFRRFESLEEFDAAWEQLRPHHARLCIKPSHSIYGLGFAVVDEERSSAALLLAGVEYHIGYQDLRRGLAELGRFRTMLLMEFLDGPEYSVDCAGDHGRLVSAVVRRKLPQAGGGQLIDMRADILEATAALCAAHRLNGVFNVQFREGGGRPRLLEINPRMSGGIGMACLAGPNLPYIALRGFADGFDTSRSAPVNNGMRVAELGTAVELP
jgi:hypothetical protein